MKATFYSSICEIPASDWNQLWESDYPFTQHAFLEALELSGSIDQHKRQANAQQSSGWTVRHLGIIDNDILIAAMPLFIKMHSYGEYVFDWSWANAYHQSGLDYYPKLVNAIPFTPATGPRVGFAPTIDETTRDKCFTLMVDTVKQFATQYQLSGFHCLFPETKHASLFAQHGFTQRLGYQYHWFNQNYTDFDDFLACFSSRKRKNLRKERSRIDTDKIQLEMREGDQVSAQEWDAFYLLYHHTYLKRSGQSGYLGADFFHRIARTMPKQVLMLSAKQDETLVAAALYLRDNDTLYGRYWGAKHEIDGLHFEACYYQGIEYAIAHKLQRFDPGAQGEHKIQRGFTPIKTSSYHWLQHTQFNHAIKEFVRNEEDSVNTYINDARALMPFKEGTSYTDKNHLL